MEMVSASLDYLKRIYRFRYFWLNLVWYDLRSRYRNSFLGIGWSLARPLALTIVFCMVFRKVFGLNIAEYAPFLLIGMSVWQVLLETVVHGCMCFMIGAPYIKQQQLPLAIFPLRNTLGACFHCLIAVALSILATWYFRGINWPIVLLGILPGLLLLFLLGVSLATLSGIMHTHFRDTQNLLEISVQILFYLTPVIYPLDKISHRGRLTLLIEYNPFSAVIEMIRTPILYGTLPTLSTVQTALVFVTVMVALASLALRKLERNLVFWV